MKFAILAVFAIVVVANAINVVDLEDLTAYNYLAKYGLPRAEEIRKSEEAILASGIVSGTQSSTSQNSYEAGLLAQFSQGQSVCGATLVLANRLITAAHCWFDGVNRATFFTVVLGSNRLFSGGTRVNTNQVVMHDQWNPPSLLDNDVAIIRINIVVISNNNITPISLPTDTQLIENLNGEIAVGSEFGRTSNGAATSQFLSDVELSIITNTVCSRSFPLIVQGTNICTSGASGRSTCSGVSGGPLTVLRNGQRILVGVESFVSAKNCKNGSPVVFTRVSSYIAFFNQNM